MESVFYLQINEQKNEELEKKMIKRIKELKEKYNVAIVAHHYAPVETHEVSDILSDSRGFFNGLKKIENQGFDRIMIVAPTFFAEIASALLPNNKVIMPILSDCPVASHLDLSFEKVFDFIQQYPDVPFVCYGTSPLEIKLLADYITIPGEVVNTIQSIDSEKVLFAGEKNCAEEAITKCQGRIINYPKNPICNVYNSATLIDVKKAKEKHSDSLVLVHPECKPEVTNAADFAIGTGEMLELIRSRDDINTYVLGTEKGFYERTKKEFPNKTIIHLTSKLICNVFKVFRLEIISQCLEDIDSAFEIKLNKSVSNKVADLFNDFFKN